MSSTDLPTKIWEEILSETMIHGDLETPMEMVINDKIDPRIYLINFAWMTGEHTILGIPGMDPPSKSALPFESTPLALLERPIAFRRFPLWFSAGYPDVVAWFLIAITKNIREDMSQPEKGACVHEQFMRLCGFQIGEEAEMSRNIDEEGVFLPRILEHLVQEYKDNSGNFLETAVESLSFNDINKK